MTFYSKYKHLIRRIFITMGILIIYRIGSFLPIPGIDQSILSQVVNQDRGGFFNMADLFSGGSLSRSSFFSISVFPYISASLLIQMLSSSIGFDFFIQLKKQGDAGQIKLNAYTKYIALVLGFSYAIRYCMYITSSNVDGFSPIYLPKIMFFLVAVPHMMAGMMFLIWLGNQITKKGIGNGISMIIFSGILSNFPSAVMKLFKNFSNPSLSSNTIIFILFFIALIILVIFIEESYLNLPVEYPSINKFGTKAISVSHHLPLKINNASIIPPIMSATTVMIPGFLARSLEKLPITIPYLPAILASFNHGQPAYYIFYGLCLVFFTIVYTPIAFEPFQLAENLKKEGCIVNQWRPGKSTANNLSIIINNLGALSAVYLLILCVTVEIVIIALGIPVYFSGTSLMISLSVALEIYRSFKSHITGVKYETIAKNYSLYKI